MRTCTAHLFEHLSLLHGRVPHAVGLAAELDEPPVVDDPVDHRRGHLVVPEHRAPPAELQVRCCDHRLPLVGVGEHLEEQPRAIGVQRQEAELVDDERPRAADERGLAVEAPFVAGAPQPHDERRRGEEAGLQPPLSRRHAQRRGHVRLAGADVPHRHEVLAALEEPQRGQVLAPESLGPRDRRPVVPVEGLRARAARSAARASRAWRPPCSPAPPRGSARPRRPAPPRGRRPRTRRRRRPFRSPEGLPAARAVHPVDARDERLGHVAPDGRLAEGPRPGHERRRQGHGVAHGRPLPEGAGQHRDPAAAVGEDLDGGGPHAQQQLPAVPGGARHVLAPVDPRVAALVRLGPDPPHGVEGDPWAGRASPRGPPAAPPPWAGRAARRGGPQPGAPVGEHRVQLGHRPDRRDGHEQVAPQEPHGVLLRALLVARVRVAEPRLEAVMAPELREQPRLDDGPSQAPARLGGVVGDHHPRGAAPAAEDLPEPRAQALRGLRPQRGALPLVGVRRGQDEELQVEGLPGDHGAEVAEVDLAGARRPLELEVALAAARRAGPAPVGDEAPHRRAGPLVAALGDEPAVDPLAVWRCLRGAPRSDSSTDSTHASCPARAGLDLGAGSGAAGDMSSVSACFATVLRLTPSLLAISARGTLSASIDRISFLMSRGTVTSSILPGRARQSLRPGTPYGEGRAPGPRGRGPRALSAQFSMTAMLKKR